MPVIFRMTISAVYIAIGMYFIWRYITSDVSPGFDIGASITCIILAVMTIYRRIFPLDFAGAILTLTCIFLPLGLFSGYDESGISKQEKLIWAATILTIDIIYLSALWKYKTLLKINSPPNKKE